MPHIANHSPRPISANSGRVAQLSGEPAPLFVYGSLRFPDVLRALLDRVPDSSTASADGWRVAALRGHVYPALVVASDQETGLLLTDLTAKEWRTLDTFENDIYDLQKLALDGHRRGWAYVCQDEASVLPHDWNAEDFANRELASYVHQCHQWRRWYEADPRE